MLRGEGHSTDPTRHTGRGMSPLAGQPTLKPTLRNYGTPAEN